MLIQYSMAKRILLLYGVIIGAHYIYGTDEPITTLSSERVEYDAIKAVIITQEGTEIITSSALQRPGLQGAVRTLEEMVFEILVAFDGKKHKVEPDEDAVDRYLAKIMEENNLTLRDLEAIFKQSGRTMQEGRDELRLLQVVNTMLDVKIRSNLVVARKDVERYYNESPQTESAKYCFRYALVPFDAAVSRIEQRRAIIKKINAYGIDSSGITFGGSFWIDGPDVAPEKLFITQLKIGKLSVPRETEEGFEIYHLVEKKEERVLSLEERYRDITAFLLRPKYEQMLQEYRSYLFDHATIIYL